MADTNTQLTDQEYERLQSYLDKMEALAEHEPEYNIGEQSSADAWEAWNSECADLNEEYGDVIMKALAVSFNDWKDSPQSVMEIIRASISDSPEEKRKALQAMHTQLLSISHYGLMNDKANREIISGTPTTREINGQISMLLGVNQAMPDRAPVPAYIALSYEGGQVSTNKRITAKDEAVFTAAANIVFILQQSGAQMPYYITPQDIWRRMNGIKDNRKSPTKKQLKEVCDSLDKLRFTNLYMDISAEIAANYITIDDDRVVNGIIDDYYLPARKERFTTEKGKEITGYGFYDIPFMYVYNFAKGHTVLVDYDLLDTSDTTGNEGYTVEFRNYLLREIGLMYRHDRDSSRILFDTIYRSTAIPTPEERTKRSQYSTEDSYKTVIKRTTSNDRKKITALLDSWTNKKWILGYDLVKKGRNYIGVDIKLNPKNYEKPAPKKLTDK